MEERQSSQKLSAVSWTRGGLECLDFCPACGIKENVCEEYCRQDDNSAMADTWRMVRCDDCHSLYLNPRPEAGSLHRAYDDYYTHSFDAGESRDAGSASHISALVNGYLNDRYGMRRCPEYRAGAYLFRFLPPLRMKLDVFGRHIPRRFIGTQTRLLDVGCGNGDFLNRASGMGLNVVGCEPDLAAAKVCWSQGLDVVQGDIFNPRFDTMKFHVITLNHVLEHVYQPHQLLQRTHDLLLPGGMVWFGLPNPNALGLLWYRKAWKGLHPPFHLIVPEQTALLSWIKEAGFVRGKLVRRGAQSPGLWTETYRLAEREGLSVSRAMRMLQRYAADLLSTLTPRWGEETIILAYKSSD